MTNILIAEDRYKNIKEIAKYIVIGAIFYVFARVCVPYTVLRPFASVMYFAMLWSEFNLWFTSISYAIGYGLGVFEILPLYVLVSTIIVGIVSYLIHKKIGRGYNVVSISIYLAISLVPMLFINDIDFQNIILGIVAIIVGVLVFLSAYIFFSATIKRGFSFKLNLDEIVCGIILLIIFSMGASTIAPYDIEFVKVAASFLILVFCYIYKDFSCMLIALSIGLGYAIETLDISYIACFGLYSLVAMGFKSNRYLSAVGIVLIEVLLNFYFKVYSTPEWCGIVATAIGGAIFLVLPKGVVIKLNDLLGGYKEKLAVRSVINRSKQGIKSRMIEVANVFGEMDAVYRSMVKGVLPKSTAKEMLKEEVIEKCCSNCPEKNTCLRQNGKLTAEVFDNLINAGFDKGKVTLIDVPSYLTSKCGRANSIILNINQLLLSYKHYATMVNNMDASRILVAEQLSGVSTIMRGLAEELDTNISFDISRENRIIEDLSYRNMMCLEALCYEKSVNELVVTILIKTFNLNEKSLEKVVSKVCGARMGIVSRDKSAVSGAVVLTLKSISRYDIVFGSASTVKVGSKDSGDTHSLIKIADGKYLMAICDGMGSGGYARKKSSLAISLIENFYKAGFDNETILSSVNKLLSLNNEESFSSVDVCVLDLNTAICDFIKLGATYGFVKRGSVTIVIESSGLPMGVLDEMRPHITKSIIQSNDIIILISDGITDSFEDREEMINFINNIDSVNPQTIADDILSHATRLNDNVPKDDMSVLVVRVYQKD